MIWWVRCDFEDDVAAPYSKIVNFIHVEYQESRLHKHKTQPHRFPIIGTIGVTTPNHRHNPQPP